MQALLVNKNLVDFKKSFNYHAFKTFEYFFNVGNLKITDWAIKMTVFGGKSDFSY